MKRIHDVDGPDLTSGALSNGRNLEVVTSVPTKTFQRADRIWFGKSKVKKIYKKCILYRIIFIPEQQQPSYVSIGHIRGQSVGSEKRLHTKIDFYEIIH